VEAQVTAPDPYAAPAIETVTLPALLHALSDPLRLAIMVALSEQGELGWSAFAAKVAPATLSHHMKVLRLAGLTRTRKDGVRCYIELRPELETRFPGVLPAILAAAPRAKV
jgi:DNA-binding transcriptional ArsR family regulator